MTTLTRLIRAHTEMKNLNANQLLRKVEELVTINSINMKMTQATEIREMVQSSKRRHQALIRNQITINRNN